MDPEIPLITRRAHAGVLVFWKKSLDPFISIIDVNSSRFHILIFSHPNLPTTVHFTIYLPTSGLDCDFVEELSKLETAFDEVLELHPDATIFVRGDANASLSLRPGNKRDSLFKCFCDRLGLVSSHIPHNTYHHFIGDISSSIDVILQKTSNPNICQENFVDVMCSKTSANVDSKHDIIISSFNLPSLPSSNPQPISDVPEVPNTKHKIIWSDSGVESYRDLLVPRLLSLRNDWANPQSPVSFSILLNLTNKALSSAAKATNNVRV